MDLLRINTAGSVDDGKSTLIGRLLYDSHALTTEQEALIEKKTFEKGLQDLDFSVITDGLIAEREQGITIDVAHIYFATASRKFIIADSPGHIEYTRNMVTGASNSQVSIILIDARKGLLEQTHRHYFISRLLRLHTVVFCINKMDLVNYDEDVFLQIASEIQKMVKQFPVQNQKIEIIPISSLKGDNVVLSSQSMPWYNGDTLSNLLHSIEDNAIENEVFRMDVQQVLHVQNQDFVDYRSYTGTIISGTVNLNDEITILPSGLKSKVIEIRKFKDTLSSAIAGESIQLRLQHDIDVSRGMMMVAEDQGHLLQKEIDATIVWLDENKATSGGKYVIQAGTRQSVCKLQQIDAIIPPENPTKPFVANEIKLNEIADVQIKLAMPIFMDSYYLNKKNGAFILINPQTNNTIAVGFIR
ncbi:sulfate adenylyltransferase subunit 1 [Flavobacterium sp. '19STA2R22 D10 B1']|uniref:sulfate adenylyltransferase subunit 1 n=1 Tax=Flavobacterium aerium TaxID=3037261 RepID=UPI00278BBF81|nr:GTP-binding protein [Flavobacterium sp. '19STA2R22 D10 B1']